MRFLTVLTIGYATATVAMLINCGGKALGKYLADSSQYHGRTQGYVGAYPQNRIANSVYGTHAYSVNRNRLLYYFTLPSLAGKEVLITARFMEIWKGAAKEGKRVFQVHFNDQMIQDNVDVYSIVGMNRPYDINSTVKVPDDGVVTVSVQAKAENAMISSIDIIEAITDTGAADSNNNNPIVPDADNKSEQSMPDGEPQLQGSGAWRTVQLSGGPEPSKRHEACAVMVNGKVVLIGGRGRRPTSVFDPKTRRWTNKSVPPVEMNHMQCVAWKDRFVYVVGAWFGPFPREKAHEVTYIYDAQTDNWDSVPGLPPSRRRGGGALVIYKNKLVLGMGNVGGHGAHATSVGWTDEFDLVKQDGWKRLADAPDPRDHVGGGVVGGKYFCIGGGRDGGVANFWGTPVTRVNCLNFDTGVWERRTDMPDGRAGASTGATCQGLLMIAGGEGRAAGTMSGGKAYDRVDLYDVQNDQFKPPVFLKRARHGSGLAVADCKCGNIYLPSGSGWLGGGPELTSTEVWSPDDVVRNC